MYIANLGRPADSIPSEGLISAGSDTVSKRDENITLLGLIALYTISSVQTLFLAMALYPDVQKKAQAEIDAVVGPNRLPDFHDRPSLPYINAVVKKSSRCNLVYPLLSSVIAYPDEFRSYSPHVY